MGLEPLSIKNMEDKTPIYMALFVMAFLYMMWYIISTG